MKGKLGETGKKRLRKTPGIETLRVNSWDAGWSGGRGRCAAAQVRGGLGGLRGAGSYLPDLVITISVPSL